MRAVRTRRGVTLAELLVALTLGAVILGAGTSSLLRQQRTASRLRGSAAGESQLRAATGALAAELSRLTRSSGDLAPGEARDTAIELRSLVAGGIACENAQGRATFAAADDSAAISGASPRAGDSLWWYAEGDGWRGRRIATSDTVAALCLLTSTVLGAARRVAIAERDSIPLGAPLRVTRPVRYDFYRGSDGRWQLGLRDWLEESGRFAPPQPVAGPFLARDGTLRTGLRYFDASGVELPIGSAGVRVEAVARVRVTILGIDLSARGLRDSVLRDSVDVALAPTRGP
jgi:prepilin-type N-terminal cleavage/methylation domain-containing protein